jgi:hypothetical protein
MAKIGRAQIIEPGQLSLFGNSAQVLAQVLEPGASVTRHTRLWRLGQTSSDSDYLVSRIGFEGQRNTFVWKEESKDFVEAPAPNGLFVPFAINLHTLSVVFQVRPPDIRVQSFAGALQGILRQATDNDWRVEAQIHRTSFQAWRATVDRVIRFNFHVEQPNPNWEGRPDLENIMERLGDLDAADFGFVAENGIVTDDELVVEIVDHVQRGYGHGSATGLREIDGRVVESVMHTDSGEIEEITELINIRADDADLLRLWTELQNIEQEDNPVDDDLVE